MTFKIIRKHGYYDGPMSGYCTYKDELYWFEMVDENYFEWSRDPDKLLFNSPEVDEYLEYFKEKPTPKGRDEAHYDVYVEHDRIRIFALSEMSWPTKFISDVGHKLWVYSLNNKNTKKKKGWLARIIWTLWYGTYTSKQGGYKKLPFSIKFNMVFFVKNVKVPKFLIMEWSPDVPEFKDKPGYQLFSLTTLVNFYKDKRV